MNEELVIFFKALADANRLKIVGLLAQQGYSVEELAALLDLKPPTVSHHLSRLAEAGLVTARAEGYYSIYQLDRDALEAAARGLFSRSKWLPLPGMWIWMPITARCWPISAYRMGRLKEIPAQRRKLEVVLRHVVKTFEPGVKYSEKQVNQKLARFHEDTATLRRELVGYGLMKREAGGGRILGRRYRTSQMYPVERINLPDVRHCYNPLFWPGNPACAGTGEALPPPCPPPPDNVLRPLPAMSPGAGCASVRPAA